MKTIGCIVQARMGSKRLPKKVLMKLNNKDSQLRFVIAQLQNCKLIEKIVVATTTLTEDDEIVEFLKKHNIECFRGSSSNVLKRYYQCAKNFSFDVIIRITADNPLIDPTIVDLAIKKFISNSFDYLTNTRKRTFPYGTEVEIFTFSALKKAYKNSTTPFELEHVTPYFYNNPEQFKIFDLVNSKDLSSFRWTVDEINDLNLVKILISKIQKRPILTNDILKILKDEPELIKINQ
ncbi:Spore coat polysaccharide biosynthesis protein SpsF [Marine Group I thaumarchaeote SCGC AAA799-P11]|uniref:Spore coat polysaccharide biosynthesis protein SpsF n=1 Tax=Marine Group I thaumarchaeote SCGC AAA799-P11 TaxID=1502295 RepID=A0A087S2Z7_9ARCH|nr:Spore coat polysaccharide biosynthesis protein SpsF [Marine Group I thaumarchaeote SCGC AAA799-P11]